MFKSFASAALLIGTFLAISQSAIAGVSGVRSSDPNGDVTIRNPRIFMRGLQLQINCNFGESDALLCRYAGLGKFVDRETGQMDVSETIKNAYLSGSKGGVSVSADDGNDWPIYDSITCKRNGSAPAKASGPAKAKKQTPAKPVKKAPAKKPVRSNAAHRSQYEDDSCGHEDDKCTSSVQCCGDGMCHDFDDHGVGKCW